MELELLFEYTIRAFLGDKAYHIAGSVHSEKERKEWYRKATKEIIKKIEGIETSVKHKEHLAYCSETILDALKERDFNETKFSVLLLRLISALLGCSGVKGRTTRTPCYFQTHGQHYTEVTMDGGDAMQDYYDSQNSIAIKKRLIQQLKDEGMSDFKISSVLNISEYQIKKLRKEEI